jgi:outer membrane lipoprotein-sorting protein
VIQIPLRNLLLLTVVASAACADVWARGIANDVASGLDKIASYRGTTVEQGLGEQSVVRTITYQKPGLVRVETLEPADHAGELFVYDGSTIVLWWPQALFGVRLRGVRLPDRQQVFEHIERLTRDNLRAYTFALRSEDARIAGHHALQWTVQPSRRAPYRFVHTVWNDERTTLPLAMAFTDEANAPWYRFEFRELAFDQVVAPDTFAFQFPDNAVVFEWDLDAPGITLDEARRKMNFSVMVPAHLPAGHEIRKIVRSSATLPMILFDMSRGATMLSLTEARYLPVGAPPLGKPVTIAGRPGVLSFLGAFTTITWVRDHTWLTLTSNLPFPELVQIAESIQ